MDERENAGFPEGEAASPYEYNPAAKAAYAAQATAAQSSQDACYQDPPAQPQQQDAPKRSKKLVIIAVIVAVVACLVWVGSCVSSTVESIASPWKDSSEIVVDSVAVIELSGEIGYDNSACSPEGFKQLLDRAQNNGHVKAVVLRVNSGGGTATAGEEMAEYLKSFSKPVVVSTASMNASAAYEISAQADCIFVARSSAVGAIGTVMQMMDYSGLMSLLGIKSEVITSSNSKDSTYGMRALTDEERAYYQHQVDQINEMFIDNVAEGRKMDKEAVRSLATGLTFTGVDAVENGLADQIGTLEDAIDMAASLASLKQYDVAYLDLGQSISLTSLLSMDTKVNITAQDLASALKELK